MGHMRYRGFMKMICDIHCPTWQHRYTGWRKWVMFNVPYAHKLNLKYIRERVMYRLPTGKFVVSPETYSFIQQNPGLVQRDGVVVPAERPATQG
jgi:hypothetical protein